MRQEIALGKLPLLTSDWLDFKHHRQKIIGACLESEKTNTVESQISPQAKHNLWESAFDFLEQKQSLIDLKLWIIGESTSMISDLNKANYRTVITESWAHVTRSGGYHRPHYHSNSTWSGIFYIDSDIEENGNNWYLPYVLERKPGLDFAEDRFSSRFVPGRMILFPSTLMHDAEPYQGKDARILIGFNLICL
jgi:uncharacterized protein (TIGR02466 family)